MYPTKPAKLTNRPATLANTHTRHQRRSAGRPTRCPMMPTANPTSDRGPPPHIVAEYTGIDPLVYRYHSLATVNAHTDITATLGKANRTASHRPAELVVVFSVTSPAPSSLRPAPRAGCRS